MKIRLYILVFFPFLIVAQKAKLNYADKLYHQYAFYDASRVYEEVLSKGIDSLIIANKIVDCYHKSGNIIAAEKWFAFLLNKDKLTKNELLQYVLLKRQLGKYDESIVLIHQFETLYGQNDVTKNTSNELINLKKTILEYTNFTLSNEKINSTSSDIGASYFGDNKVLISSSKKSNNIVNRVYSWTGDYFYNIYVGQLDSAGSIISMNEINGKLNTNFHDGPACFDAKNGFVYFTRNDFFEGHKGMDSEKRMRLKIYRAKFINNELTDIEELPFNNSSYSCAHTSISEDGKMLFFSSDMPGGFGGADIYSVKISENGSFGTPVNLGSSINTSQNEFFPFYRSKENILFFSSNGHYGYGGLDVYVAKLSNDKHVKSLENLGQPINSNSDDFSFVNNTEQSKGFFTSNRNDGIGNDDIYSFHQFRPFTNIQTIHGKVTDLFSNNQLQNTVVYLETETGDRIDSTITDEFGVYNFNLNIIKNDFIVSAKLYGYTSSDSAIKFSKNQDIYEKHIQLTPFYSYVFNGTVKDKKTLENLKDVKVTIVDSKTNKVISTLQSNIIGKFETDVITDLHYKDSIVYKFRFEKKGYLVSTQEIRLSLSTTQKINVSELLNANLFKVSNGETNLANILDINPIYFDYNQANIRPDAAIELDKIVQVMLDNPKMIIAMYSHTDSRGSERLNESLSNLRALSSIEYIISKGISSKRISGKGKGENELKVSDEEIQKAHKWEKQEELHQLNRRTEFIVVKLN